MTLIPNAGCWYKMISVQALLFIGALQAILGVLPPEALAVVLYGEVTVATIGKWATIAAAAVGAVGRVIDQQLATTPQP